MQTSTFCLPFAKAVAAVRGDYRNALGTTIYPAEVTVWTRRERDTQHDILTGHTVACRVIETADGDLLHDTGEHLDPYWNVEIIADPYRLLPEGYEPASAWTFGPSYQYRDA